jgi:hypothetical protein
MKASAYKNYLLTVLMVIMAFNYVDAIACPLNPGNSTSEARCHGQRRFQDALAAVSCCLDKSGALKLGLARAVNSHCQRESTQCGAKVSSPWS